MSHRRKRRRFRPAAIRRRNSPTPKGPRTPEEVWDSMRPVWPDGKPAENEFQRLAERAHFAMFQGRIDEAEKLFRQILEQKHVPAIANNVALLELNHHNRPDEALRILAPNLDEVRAGAQPYAHALAARCLVRLNRKEEAREAVERAVRHFEAGLPQLSKTPDGRRAWQEYTSCLLEAAGQLGDDHYVWELYQRWTRHHVRDTSHYFGGVAAFNLQRYNSARAAWSRIRDRGRGFMDAWDTVASWLELGVIEPFSLEYEAVGPKTGKQIEEHFMSLPRGAVGVRTEDYLRAMGELLERPVDRLWIVWKTFRPLIMTPGWTNPKKGGNYLKTIEGALAGILSLVAAGGEWGKATAHRLLHDPHCPHITKVYVVIGLELGGHLGSGEPVALVWEGETREMTLPEMFDGLQRLEGTGGKKEFVGVGAGPHDSRGFETVD